MGQKLTKETIFDKEFHVDFKGYNAIEVDEFLDDVIQDYEFFQSIIEQQQELLDNYEETLAQQRRSLLELESKNRVSQEFPSQFSHVDILKRISRLEQAVFEGNNQ